MNDKNEQAIMHNGKLGIVDWSIALLSAPPKFKIVYHDGTTGYVLEGDEYDVLSPKEAEMFRLLMDIKRLAEDITKNNW